jgi:CRP-like cAMP-binding protein
MNPFYNINSDYKSKLLKELEAQTYEFSKNEEILKKIKNRNYIGIILNGTIQIIKTDYNGNRTIIEELIENDIFGTKISSLSNNEYTITTKDKTKIIIIDYEQLIKVNNQSTYYNQFIKNLLEIIINSVNDKNDRIEILTKKTIRNKLLEYFRIISTKNKSKNIYLPFTFTDLADYLAIDRSAMTRELKYLKEEGFIEIKNKRITLLY